MAQLVARLVRNEKVGGSNPPSSTTGRHPIRMSVFCMFGCVGVVPVGGLLVAPLVFRAPVGPAAREARHPHFVRCRASKPARALRSLRRPSHRRGLSLWVARPSPATAHGQRGLALRSLRCPPHRRCLRRCVADVPGQAPPPPTSTVAWPSGPSGTLHTCGDWCADVLLGPSSRSPAALLSLTGAAGDSRETVIAFAGVCSVSGETGDTIASQIHLFLAQFW